MQPTHIHSLYDTFMNVGCWWWTRHCRNSTNGFKQPLLISWFVEWSNGKRDLRFFGGEAKRSPNRNVKLWTCTTTTRAVAMEHQACFTDDLLGQIENRSVVYYYGRCIVCCYAHKMATCVLNCSHNCSPKALISVRCRSLLNTHVNFYCPSHLTNQTTSTQNKTKQKKKSIQHEIEHLFGRTHTHAHKHDTLTNAMGSSATAVPFSHDHFQSKWHRNGMETLQTIKLVCCRGAECASGAGPFFIAFIDHHERAR